MLDIKKPQDRGDTPWLAVEDKCVTITGNGYSGPNIIKLSTFIKDSNKLEGLPSLMFVNEGESEAPFRCSTLGKATGLTHKH